MPPELLRKGRFDEIWFVGLPSRSERAAIAEATLLQMQPKAVEAIDLNAIADVTGRFTGAEIAAMVPEAMFTAFNDGKRLIRPACRSRAFRGVILLGSVADEVPVGYPL